MSSATAKVSASVVPLPLRMPFVVSGYSWTTMRVVHVTLSDGTMRGRGEGAPLFYRGETAEDLLDALTPLLGERSIDALREATQPDSGLPSGARNALDCALWDLRARQQGRPAHALAGMATPAALTTVMTISLGPPEAMAASAAEHADRPLLKIKLGAETGDDDRLRAVRAAAPKARLIVDANCGWQRSQLDAMGDALVQTGVEMVEQPLAPEQDEALRGYASDIPLCADESCFVAADVARLKGLYQMINIKLDKCGGLTSALALADAAENAGMQLMVGNMLGSSLGMAPAHLIGQRCQYVDIDGPLYLKADCSDAMRFDGSVVSPPPPALWGGP